MSHENIAAELRESFQDKEYAYAYVEDFLNAAIATQIKVLREDRQLTQGQLAELAGMKQGRISLMENVNYGSWSMTTLRRLAAAFDVTLKVSFESFSKTIAEVSSFSREALQRPSRTEELRMPLEIDLDPSWIGGKLISENVLNVSQSALGTFRPPEKNQEDEFSAASQTSTKEERTTSALAQWARPAPQLQNSLMGSYR